MICFNCIDDMIEECFVDCSCHISRVESMWGGGSGMRTHTDVIICSTNLKQWGLKWKPNQTKIKIWQVILKFMMAMMRKFLASNPKIHDTYEMSIYKFPGFKRKVTINVELRAKRTQQRFINPSKFSMKPERNKRIRISILYHHHMTEYHLLSHAP